MMIEFCTCPGIPTEASGCSARSIAVCLLQLQEVKLSFLLLVDGIPIVLGPNTLCGPTGDDLQDAAMLAASSKHRSTASVAARSASDKSTSFNKGRKRRR